MRLSIPGFKTQYIDEPEQDAPAPPKADPLPSIQQAMAMADARHKLSGPISNPDTNIIPPVRMKPLRESAK